jgi:hypothetical protein
LSFSTNGKYSETAILRSLAPAISLPTNYCCFGRRSTLFLRHPLAWNGGNLLTLREKSRHAAPRVRQEELEHLLGWPLSANDWDVQMLGLHIISKKVPTGRAARNLFRIDRSGHSASLLREIHRFVVVILVSARN